MDLSFFPLTLEAIDQAAAEALCLFISADERPLTGLAGLADWAQSPRVWAHALKILFSPATKQLPDPIPARPRVVESLGGRT